MTKLKAMTAVSVLVLAAAALAACGRSDDADAAVAAKAQEEAGHAEEEGGHAEKEASHAEEEAGEGEEVASAEISEAARVAAGVVIAPVGAGAIRETRTLTGRVMLQPSARAEVRAQYPGPVKSVEKNIGDPVKRGDMLARVESAESLETYAVRSPIDGIVLERTTNVGDVTDGAALFLVGDLTRLQAELNVVTHDIDEVAAGQKVIILGLDGEARVETTIASVLPVTDAHSQTLIARAPIEAAGAASLRPGMAIRGEVVIAEQAVAVAVPPDAVQSLEGKSVVFVEKGERLEARPVTLGRSGRNAVEITAGLEAGERVVVGKAFLVKAEIGKGSAEHGH